MEGGAVLANIRGPDFYAEKYLSHGCASVAFDGDRLVGMTAGTPRKLSMAGRTLEAADLGDLFVDPAYRGRGLFRRLHDLTFDQLRQRGVEIVTVQPGPAAVPALTRALGYTPAFEITEWVGIVDRSRASEGRRPLRRLLLRLLPEISAAGGRAGASAFGSDVVPSWEWRGWPQATTLRDADWLSRRYVSGSTPYEIVSITDEKGAAIVVYVIQSPVASAPPHAWITDGWASGERAVESARALLAAVFERFRSRGVAMAHAWSARGASADPFVRALRSLGLRRRPHRKRLRFRWLRSGSWAALPEGPLWLFRMGDTDGV